MKLTSPKMVGPGGQFSLVLQDHNFSVSPVSCQAVVPDALRKFFLSKEGSCRDIILALRGGPLPMSADGRSRFGDPTTFIPSVIVRFGGSKPDLDVVGLEGGEPLAIDNSVRLVIAPESHLVLSPRRPFVIHVRLQAGTMPGGFRCDWSDTFGRVWDVDRTPLSASGCDYQIALVDGPLTTGRRRDYAQVGEFGQAIVDLGGFTLELTAKVNGEVVGRSPVHARMDLSDVAHP